jgi:hypothetical protein
MKKPKMVAELLVVIDMCIEAFEARARLLESQGKGPSRKKDDREVNTTDQGDRKDRRDHGIVASSPWSRRKIGPFSVPMM